MRKFFYLCSIVFISCGNDDNHNNNPVNNLVPATTTGEHTMGFLINGEAVNIRSVTKLVAIYQDGLFQMVGKVQNDFMEKDVRFILIDPIEQNVDYNLANYQNSRAGFIDFSQFSECSYEYEHTFEGNIKFSKIDSINFIASGEFEFSTVTDNCDTIKITNGRFDLKYIP